MEVEERPVITASFYESTGNDEVPWRISRKTFSSYTRDGCIDLLAAYLRRNKNIRIASFVIEEP